jgi:hypothetical protein
MRTQVFQGRHLHRDVAVKVLQMDGSLVRAVQREVRRQFLSALGALGALLLDVVAKWDERDVNNTGRPVAASSQCTAAAQVQLAERVSRDANVVQVYGAAVAEDAVLLVMELMQARVEGSRCHFVYCKHHACSVAKYSTRSGTAVL